MGHTSESYEEPLFVEHLRGAISWAAGVEDADIGATMTGSYDEVVLEDDTTYPMQLQVADDGRVFWIERTGAVKIWDPATASTVSAGYVPVTDKIEDGLLGIELDPNFSENQWIYFYYTPISEDPNRLSRFTMNGNELDLVSEVIMLEVRMQREECCHSAGELHFDHEGNLWLTTGDNTGGSAPRTDERPGREFYDAQRTTANTNDLRGKILRITPQADGSYTIPEGNLFEDDDPLTRPEIYTMGMRNPWRFFVDPETGWVFWGEVGPANQFQEGNAPLGNEEFNLARGPGFFGWPYFNGPNGAYRDYDYETEEYGELPDAANPINDSPNNTGILELPPAQPSWIWYSYGPSEEFPEMGVGGMSASAGFRYHYDPEIASPRALPPYYDGKVFLFEWMRNWIQDVVIDENGDPVEITAFTPEITYTRPVDIELGPNQELYVLEWGEEFWGQNRDGQLVRIDYYGSEDRPPTVVASAEPASGAAPLQVSFDASGSESRGGGSLAYAWDFDGDGAVDAETASATHRFTAPGSYTAHLTVTDANGLASEKELAVTAGNTAPEVAIAWPPDGGIVPLNEPVPYSVDVTDAEDGPVVSPGPQVTLQPKLTHDTHTHALHQHRGNEGTFNVVPDTSHAPYLIDEYIEVVASYTDEGASNAPRLTSSDTIRLYPSVVQAEHYMDGEGIGLSTTGSRQSPTWAQDTNVFLEAESGGYARYASVNLHGIEAIVLGLVADAAGSVEVRLDGIDGELLGSADLVPPEPDPAAEDGQRRRGPRTIDWVDHRMEFDAPAGSHDLYVVFRGPDGEDVARFDRIRFEGEGVTAAPSNTVSAAVW
jgi:glucose/arabinose dehydrogenase